MKRLVSLLHLHSLLPPIECILLLCCMFTPTVIRRERASRCTEFDKLARNTRCSSVMKVASQIDWVVKKPFATLAFVNQGIECKSWDILLPVYKTLAWLCLEYCVQLRECFL